MALKLTEKKVIVNEVSGVASKAISVVAAEYRGMTVSQLTLMRKAARESNVYLKVVKNTLASKAVEGTNFDCIRAKMVGPLILAFALDEPGASARLIADFVKISDKLVPKVIAVGGNAYDGSELDRLAKLPNRDQALAMLMGTMKAPIEKLVRTLAEPHAKLVRTIAAIKDTK